MVSAVNLSATATPDLRTTARDIQAVAATDPSAVRGSDAFPQGAQNRGVTAVGSATDDATGGGSQGQSNTGNGSGQGSFSTLTARIGNFFAQLLSQQESAQGLPARAPSQASAAYQATTTRSEQARQPAADLLLPNLPPQMASGRRLDLLV